MTARKELETLMNQSGLRHRSESALHCGDSRIRTVPARYLMHSRHFAAACLLVLILTQLPLFAQQSDPRLEIYGTTGAYYFAQESHLFKSRRWAPQFGVGLLLPLNSRWGVLLDGKLSRLQVNEGLHDPLTGHPASIFYRVNPSIPNEDVTIQWQLSVYPSIVRMWRNDRFSVYLGGGLGLSYDYQTIRHRPIHGDFAGGPDGDLANDSDLVRSEQFEIWKDTILAPTAHFSGGVIFDISRSLVSRFGVAINPTALDAPLAKSLLVGLGYRF